jgi:hypothetical protein
MPSRIARKSLIDLVVRRISQPEFKGDYSEWAIAGHVSHFCRKNPALNEYWSWMVDEASEGTLRRFYAEIQHKVYLSVR